MLVHIRKSGEPVRASRSCRNRYGRYEGIDNVGLDFAGGATGCVAKMFGQRLMEEPVDRPSAFCHLRHVWSRNVQGPADVLLGARHAREFGRKARPDLAAWQTLPFGEG